MAGRAGAHLDDVPSLGLEAQGLIEGGHGVQAGHGAAQIIRQGLHPLPGDIIEMALHILEHSQAVALLCRIPMQDIRNGLQIHLHRPHRLSF